MSITRLSLLDRLRQGHNSSSWNEFARQYFHVVDEYARPYCRSVHDQKDIVQNVWLTLCRLMPRFHYEPGRGGFRRLLKRIVRNTAIDWFRRRNSAPLLIDSSQWPAVNTETTIVDDDRQVLLRRAMEITRCQMNVQAWTCFERHVLQEVPAQQVADQLQISANAVYVNASRTLQKIRNRCRLLEQAAHYEL